MIEIKKIDDCTFDVTVSSTKTTRHQVSVDKQYYEKLTGGKTTQETLIQRSFEFLLEREPNTSILPSFNLKVISQYFPEYEQTIGQD